MGTLKSLGYINKIAAFPCVNPDPWIVVQAGGTAAFTTLMAAVSFGCNDIVKMKAGISPWHARGMRALINKSISPDSTGVANKLLKYTIPIEKALFFFFVVDLTTEFIANWTSQIFVLGGCDLKPNECHWNAGGAAWVTPGGDGYAPIGYTEISSSGDCAGVVSNGFAVPGGWYFQSYFSLQAKAFRKSHPVGSVKLRLRRFSPSSYAYPPSEGTPPWFGNNIQVNDMISGQNKTSGTQVYQYEASADEAAEAAGGSAAVIRSPIPIHENTIIPVNCFGKPAPGAVAPDFEL